MSVAPILIVVLSYNIWNNTLHWQYPSPTVAPRQLNSSQLWSWISPNVSISHLLHCSVYYLSSQGGSFDPRTSFPGAPISLSHPALLSQACDRGSWTNTQRHTGTTVNPCLLCKLRSHVVTSASYVVWVWSPLSVNMRRPCHHQLREKCIRRSGLTLSVLTSELRWRGWVSLNVNTAKYTKCIQWHLTLGMQFKQIITLYSAVRTADFIAVLVSLSLSLTLSLSLFSLILWS